MKTLFELSNDLRVLDINLDTVMEDETLTEEERSLQTEFIVEAYMNTEGAVKDKLVNCARYIKELESLTKIRKEEAQRLSSLAKSVETRASNLREYVVSYMTGLGLDKVEGSSVKLSTRRKPPQLELKVDINELPEQYKRVKVEVDKQTLRADLSAGSESVKQYAELVPSTEYSLQIR